jgi:ubiquitin carboxyl-terminal hydrolase 22/27/51
MGLPSMHSPFSSEFELFAVVTHSGKLDSGHYVCFLRLSGRWYKCDDAWVTRVSEDVVRASQGYMLYYVQKTLSYKASDLLPSSTPDILDKNGKHGGYSCVSGLPSIVNGV